jgi:hypothetical protein
MFFFIEAYEEKSEIRTDVIFIYTYANVICIKRNERKINVKDIIKENIRAKQNECVTYEEKKNGRNKMIVLVVITRSLFEHQKFFFFSFLNSSNQSILVTRGKTIYLKKKIHLDKSLQKKRYTY